jgi:homoserine kinase
VRVHVRVPASSANLGPGFDALGLALGLYNEIEVSESDRITITIAGEGSGELAANETNVVARAVRAAYEAAGRSFRGCAIACVNRIPLARGLGSSAAAWVGGLVAGNALLGSPLDRDSLLVLAARAEGHPDNVAAALLGGLTVAYGGIDGARAVSLPVSESLRWIVLVPGVSMSTAQARAILPEAVPRADAVFNVQRVALLLASLQAGRVDLLPAALEDRLHEPYRLRLFPWMSEVVKAARATGALGCVLSGAGPSLLAVTSDEARAAAVGRAMERALEAAGVKGVARSLPVDTEGAVSRIVERG